MLSVVLDAIKKVRSRKVFFIQPETAEVTKYQTSHSRPIRRPLLLVNINIKALCNKMSEGLWRQEIKYGVNTEG